MRRKKNHLRRYLCQNMTKKRKAIFLDRDGTIIKHIDHLTKPSQVRILPGAAKAIGMLNDLGYLVFVVTNQAAIARGLITPGEVEEINALIVSRLEKKGATIHAVYYCPHHPETHPDAPKHAIKYRIICECRKPAPGMLIKAIKEFDVDEEQSFMIGDAMTDIVAGKRANLKTIRVKTGPGHVQLDPLYRNIKPDFEVTRLLDAVMVIRAMRINNK